LIEKLEQQKTNVVSITDLLKDRYSPSFTDFLCKCLKFDWKERESIKNLVAKETNVWLNLRNIDKTKMGMEVTIKELLTISGGYTESKR
jgi:hypothetical protein